jgi:hypothetical protein
MAACRFCRPLFRCADYRPRAQGGFKEDIDATLDRLKAIGVRQVQIQTMFAWSVETAPSPRSGAQAVVYYKSTYKPDDPTTWGKVSRARRGDIGLIAYQPPAFWDQPVQLKNPLQINARAEQVLGELLDAAAARR